jgi:hypothetical protein
MSAMPLRRDTDPISAKPVAVVATRTRSSRSSARQPPTAKPSVAKSTVAKPALVIVARKRRWPAVVAGLAWAALFAGLLGAAVFHTQLAERQLHIDRLERAVEEQRELFDELRYERAELRSPVRLAEAAGAMGMERGDTGEFIRVTPEAVARQIVAAGSIDDGTVRVIVETDPLQQFRDVKAVTANAVTADAAADPVPADPVPADPVPADPAAADPATNGQP